MKCTKIAYTISNETGKQYHITRFDDEQTVSLNLIENGKFISHIETPITPNIKKFLNMEQGEQIRNEQGVTITITEKTEETF